MIVDARARAWVQLHAAAIPAPALSSLLRAFGSAEAVLAATPANRRRIVPSEVAARLEASGDEARLAATLEWLGARDDRSLLAWDDPEFPRTLLEIGDPPPLLFCLGRRALLAQAAIAIVGSRNATPQGRADAEAFAATLSAAGLTIVSGLAIGIDAAAHRGGLAHAGSSIAVVGTGLDRVYPATNRKLAQQLSAHGLLISEYAPGTPALKHHFPRRNRLVSGLARGVLVVEATLSSGSLITARLAAEQGREVFAVPGSIHSPFSKGCHRLIREGAKLVETADDILVELNLAPVAPLGHARPDAAQDEPEHALLAALGYDPADIDTLASRTGMSASVVAASLTTLEIDARVAALPGGLWQRLPARPRTDVAGR